MKKSMIYRSSAPTPPRARRGDIWYSQEDGTIWVATGRAWPFHPRRRRWVRVDED